MFTTGGILYFTFGISLLLGICSLLRMTFSASTLYYSSKEIELGQFKRWFFEHVYYADEFNLITATLVSGLGMFTHLILYTSSDTGVGVISKCIMLAIVSISTILPLVVSEDFIGFEFDSSDSNSKKLLGYLLYRKIKKNYSSDTASLIKLIHFKGTDDAYYESDRAPLQRVLLSLSSLIIQNNYNTDTRNRIENALKSQEFLDLSGPLLNILANDELFAFIKTKKGSESIKDFVAELRSFVDTLKKELIQVNTIEKSLTDAEMILELESLTKNKLSRDFMKS